VHHTVYVTFGYLFPYFLVSFKEWKHCPHEIVRHGSHEAALPVNQDRFNALALELFKIDLDLPLKQSAFAVSVEQSLFDCDM
jgi:hypothetical protein